MFDVEKYSKVVAALPEAQSAEHDMRENAREAKDFVLVRGGQWEANVWQRLGTAGRPRYTLDKTTPIINQIHGEIVKSDFDIKVKPASGIASKDTAKVLDGMVRNIENLSDANQIYNQAARSVITSGADGWMIVQDYADTDSFDQDLFIRPIPNFLDSVYFDPNSTLRDRSDAMYAYRLVAMTKDAYKDKWPEGNANSVTSDRTASSYWNQPDKVTVAEFYYVKLKTETLVKMSNGAVYELEEELVLIADELAQAGIVEVGRREIESREVYLRHFDGDDWLDDPQETVFSWIPLIPAYSYFDVVDNVVNYFGVVEKLMDAQRIYNYAISRKIEEGALSPKDKLMMTPEQAAGHSRQLSKLNTSSDPVQFYNHIDGQMPPFKVQQSQINAGLAETAQSSNADISEIAGLFAANMGDNPNAQSGVAIEALQNRGSVGTTEFFTALEVAIRHTGRILVEAIPKVYDTERQVRLLSEDGTIDYEMINQRVVDQQTGQVVMLNDLSVGRYLVSCEAGRSFSSRRQESVAAILEMAQVDPSIIQTGSDVLLNSTGAPGLDVIAERKRAELLNAGIIPQTQWTEEEIAQAQQAAQQPQPEDPNMVLAQAEMAKAQAMQADSQIKAQEMQMKAQELQAKAQEQQINSQLRMAEIQQKQKDNDAAVQLKAMELNQKGQKDAITAQQKQLEFDLKLQSLSQEIQLATSKEMRETKESLASVQKTLAETMKLIREALGADAIVTPTGAVAFERQARTLVESQDDV